MRTYLADFFREFSYPQECRLQLLDAYDKILRCPGAIAVLEQLLRDYAATNAPSREHTLLQSEIIAREAGILEDEASFLVYACFSKHLRQLYQAKGIPLNIWQNSMEDLRIKALECKKVKGHWGSFVSGWFTGWFDCTRFALGRLQFEVRNHLQSYGSYRGHGITLDSPEEPVIFVHIPSGSRLPYEEVMDSYKQAYQWYREYHRDGKLVFACHSWLMYDAMPEIAGQNTNTYRFIMDYETVSSHEDPHFEDCWRLFDVPYTGDPSLLPRNGSLRKRYAEYLEAGNLAGVGYGIAIFDGEKILTRKQNSSFSPDPS